ncbi:MAG: beta-ketoacyl synthase N-terminal-like domain-containing protein [Alphaproteobacteria bacterium]
MTPGLVITGAGIAAAGAVGVPAFEAVLRAGRTAIVEDPAPGIRRAALLSEAAFAPAAPADSAAARALRGANRAARSAVAVAGEACAMAGLADRGAAALVVAGHNLAPAATAETLREFADRPRFAPPRHGVQSWDSHVLGVVSAVLGLRGPGMLAGGHFASGIAALALAALLLRSGEAEVAVCVAPCVEPTSVDLHALANLGATASLADEAAPYQPFGAGQSGFVLGQGAAALVVETAVHASRRGVPVLAGLGAATIRLAGTAGPEPDGDTEARVMRAAVAAAGLAAADIGYVNAHATGTPAGDAVEIAAIRAVFGDGGPRVNATKALAGHTLFAAGLVGAVATILQLRGRFLHADPYLLAPPPGLAMAGPGGGALDAGAALCNAFGFDGINGAAVLIRGATGS